MRYVLLIKVDASGEIESARCVSFDGEHLTEEDPLTVIDKVINHSKKGRKNESETTVRTRKQS
jgi:hypothetical protein